MNALYARKEPTTDPHLGTINRKGKKDVILYSDSEATQQVSRYPWHYTLSKPDKRNKKIMHNCAEYDLVWLPDKETK